MAAPAPRLLVSALLAIGAARLVSGTPCPADWLQSGAWCYLTNTSSTLSWAGAQEHCQEHGGSLVMMEDRSKLLDVVDLLKGLNSAPAAPVPAPLPLRWTDVPQMPPLPPDEHRRLLSLLSGPAALGYAVGLERRWWIGIRKTSGTTSMEERQDGALDNFGEEKVIKNASSGESGSHQCVFLTAADGFWYWTACDTPLNYVCQKAADRVQVAVVSPDRQRPDPVWLRAHEAALLAGLRPADDSTDDKGEYSASKATMTPIPPPSTTTPLPPTLGPAPSGGGGSTAAPATTTPSPCTGENWWLLTSRCHHIFLDVKSYAEAEQSCADKGGHLAQFDSEEAQRTFRARYQLISGSVWIGLSRPDQRSDFRWASGGQPAFAAWAPGHPNANRTCVTLDLRTAKWLSTDCATKKPFACCRSVDATERPPTVTTTPAPVSVACGGGDWWQFGSTCLLLVSNSPASWHASELDCRGRGGTLVKVTSVALNQHIRGKLSGVSAWIGLTKLNSARAYRWTDGSAVAFANWSGASTTGTDMASCALLDGGHGYWRAVNCNAPQPHVCQRPVYGGRPQLAPPEQPAPRSSCPDSWQPYGVDRCLRLVNRNMSWTEARQWCRDQADGGDLISVPNAVYQAFLTSAVRGSKANLWISLSYDEVDHQRFLTWTDETPVNYTNWAPGQPSTLCDTCPKTCGVIDGRRTTSAATWSDVDCSMRYGAVCQRPATPNNSLVITQTFCNNTNSYVATGGSCYKVSHDSKTWHDATDVCQADGGALAYVGDLFDNAELVKLLFRHSTDVYWLGLSDTARHGMMEWTSPWPPVATFVNWDPDYSRKPTRDSCAAFVPTSGRWQHRDCALERHPFVCQVAPERQAAAQPGGRCSAVEGWIAGDSRCYRAFEPSGAGFNWTEAKTGCEQRGYQLATVSSVTDFWATRDAVQTLSSRLSAWIGLSSRQNKEYNWADGSPMAYRAWQRSEPTRPAGCVQVSRHMNGRWETVDCGRRTAYICMKAMKGPGAGAITGGESSGGGGGWTAFGVVVLVLVLTAALAGLGLWFARRQRAAWLPSWLLSSRGTHHSVENLAYSRHQNSDSAELTVDNGNLDTIAAHRFGSEEQLVMRED
ncbi:macrophage mannose receptor 1-like isoform X1 [Amphibalanus amphitrite]|uniref:macrophage mannose receptor 1-like isoform X1 n=1 Tax=Amphibalanus amphitrite TaxID=1232801 RepID=UPI001C928613|nr:macrophage mannose receptor 1-like isoform X1 [Amphibalanus amphitrite]